MARKRFRDLLVWQKAHEFFLLVADDVKKFPKGRAAWTIEENLLRAANSVGANIAEGCERKTNKEFKHFLGISKGSVGECVDQYLKAGGLDFLPQQIVGERVAILDEIDKMLRSFMYKLG